MKKLVFDDKHRVNIWVSERIGRPSIFAPESKYNAFGIEKDGELIGGVVFEGFSEDARCSMHCAGEGKHWLTKDFIFHCFNYVFNVANCKVVINTVDVNNKPSMKFTEHIGFSLVGIVRDGCGNSDLAIFAMHREECKWLGEKND